MRNGRFGLLFRAVMLALASGLAAGADEIATRDFMKTPMVEYLILSPDGALLFAKGNNGAAIIRLEDTEILRVFGTENQQDVYQMWWLSNERVMYNTTRKGLGVDTVYLTGQFHSLNVDGTRKLMLFGQNFDNHRLIDVLEDDPDRILVERKVPDSTGMLRASRPVAYLKDVRTRSKARRRVASPLPTGSLYADNDGQVRLAVGRESDDFVKVKFRPDPRGMDWIDLSAKLSGGVDSRVSPLSFTPNNDGFFFLSRLDGDTRGLYLFNLAKQTVQLLYRHPKFDLSMSAIRWNADGDVPIGALLEAEYPSPVTFFPDVSDARLQQAVDRAFPNSRTRITSRTKDRRKAVILVSSDRNAGEFYLFDQQTMQLQALGLKVRPELDQEAMREMTPFSIESRDGRELVGYLTFPQTEQDSPLVVIAHGGPHGVRDRWGFDPEVQLLANRGFAVMSVNFRGSGGFGHDFETAGHREWGGKMIDDVIDATSWARRQPGIDGDRVCIAGASFGGYASISAVIKEPDLFKCAIGVVGVYDLEMMFKRGDIPSDRRGTDFLEQVLGTDMTALRAASPAYNAEKIKVPLFIAYGTEDRRVPPAQAKALRASLDEHDISYEWLVELEGHGFYDDENRINLYDRMIEFLRKHTAP